MPPPYCISKRDGEKRKLQYGEAVMDLYYPWNELNFTLVLDILSDLMNKETSVV